MRVTECGEEAWSINHEPMNKNRIKGAVEQGEWARNCEALVTKAKRRRCGGFCLRKKSGYGSQPAILSAQRKRTGNRRLVMG